MVTYSLQVTYQADALVGVDDSPEEQRQLHPGRQSVPRTDRGKILTTDVDSQADAKEHGSCGKQRDWCEVLEVSYNDETK